MHTSHLPYTRLFLHEVHSIAIAANGHIQVLDSSTGAVLRSTATNTKQKEKVAKLGPILGASVDDDFTHLVTSTSEKTITVWDITELRVVSERKAPKKPTDVHFTRDGQTVIVSDKFGDVHSYPLLVSDEKEDSAEPSTSEKAKTTAKSTTDGSLLLGHVSLVTTFLLSKDEKYIITADRDEHIRVSWFPEAYTIERYCLGHRKFVSALHIPSWDPSLLVSGGGDPMLKIWNWMDGRVVCEVDIADAVMPFVKVVRGRPRWGEGGSDAEGEEGDVKLSARQRRKNKKKVKGKGKEKAEAEEGVQGNVQHEMDVDEQRAEETKVDAPAECAGEAERDGKEQPPRAAPLLAIQKISTLETPSAKLLVFSAHGATSLFYCNFPDLSGSSTAPEICSVVLNQPVLDFVSWPTADELWVSVDGTWSEDGSFLADGQKLIRILKVVGDELVLSDGSAHQALVNSLNTTSRLEATPETLERIDLYSALIVLPKNVDAEHNAMEEDLPLSEAVGGQLSGKELGRLKAKQAVLARQAALASKREQSETLEEDRDVKRQKSEPEADTEP